MNFAQRTIAILAIALLAAPAASAQILPGNNPQVDSAAFARVRARMDSIRQYRPTVGLVLGGGGARGMAHLGVIRYMEELGIPVDIVTGTSMGGLVGGLYSMGYNHKQLDSLVRAIEWPVMMSDNIPNAYVSYRLRKYRERFVVRVPFKYDKEDLKEKRIKELKLADKIAEERGSGTSDILTESISKMGVGMPDGFLFGINIRNMLSSVTVGYQDSLSFASLPIPFACVATDLGSLKPKYWTHGTVVDALRSTMAIPFYFRAVRKDGEILLDGGMRNNVPADIAREMGADIIIGSEVQIFREPDELNNPADFVFQTIALLASGAMKPTLEMIDHRVHHDLDGYTMLSFDDKSVDDIINQGYANATSHKEMFEQVAALTAGKTPENVVRHKSATNIALNKVWISDIQFSGITEKEKKYILDKLLYTLDKPYGKEDIERLLNYIYGSNAFESVTYRLEGSCEPYTLVFDCQKGQINDLAVNVHADTDEIVYVGAHLGLGTRRLSGFRFTTDIKLGGNFMLNMDAAYKPMIGIPTFGVAWRNRLRNHSYTDNGLEALNQLYNMAFDLYMEDSRMTYGNMRAGVTFEMEPFEHYLSAAESWKGWDWQSFWVSAFGKICVDTFNDGYFPTKGFQTVLDARLVFAGHSYDLTNEGIDATGHVSPYVSSYFSLTGAFTPFDSFTIQPFLYAGFQKSFSPLAKSYLDTMLMTTTHIVSVGGVIPGRYVERQLPFFGFPTGFRTCGTVSAVAQLDLRYNFARKNFVTLRGGFFSDAISVQGFKENPIAAWAVGAELARQTVVGPLKLSAQWCNRTRFTIYASIGFDF